ncbi:hypothetical protein ACS0TY_024090 [Phlomoides rotata]
MMNVGFCVCLCVLGRLVTRTEGGRAFFVFGDSLVDNGNNNYLFTTARADSPPYGIDYPTHRPTGRFSNGYNIPDLISQKLGAESTLAYLDPELTGQKLLIGANFASAGVGILNDTGFQFVNMIRMSGQLEYFEEYQKRVKSVIGEEQSRVLVNKALVLITLGGNDFVNNYFLTPITIRRLQYNLQDYSHYLISEYKKILQRLYELGCRRVLVTGVGPLGCAPAELAMRSTNGECAEEPNRASDIFNSLLRPMIADLNKQYGSSNTFVAVNALQRQKDLISDPKAYGFETAKVACCGQGPYNGLGLCTIASNICEDRDKYVFWDAFHPSDRANRIIVQTIYNGSDEYMAPMNLKTIMDLD